jgi:hypothetical protein
MWLLLSLTQACLAHELDPVECDAPIRPADDQNDLLWQAFLNEIDEFRDCVTQQMALHEQAAKSHQAAAREAVENWNAFVRDSLNAPEDFPWPPEPPK